MPNLPSLLGHTAMLASGAAAVALSAYNVDPSSVSVSGVSSGGMFSVQLGVAYSNIFPVGFSVFAGGPYDCARNQSVCPFLIFLQTRPNFHAVSTMHEQQQPLDYDSHCKHEGLERQ